MSDSERTQKWKIDRWPNHWLASPSFDGVAGGASCWKKMQEKPAGCKLAGGLSGLGSSGDLGVGKNVAPCAA